ncbi:MAG: hypothetical protein KAV87_19925 [Desulfobacteraceae bacterium]|nr:hypothetical protein [Desulfobacteraceae bacterium]
MNELSVYLHSWQKDNEGTPIFRSTNDAHTYAHLIVDDNYACARMKILKKSAYDELDTAREAGHISLQGLLNMACRCQLFRECVEEIQRIKDERISI